MNIQKIYSINENASSWTVEVNGKTKNFYRFCDVCDWAFAAHANGLNFSIINNV